MSLVVSIPKLLRVVVLPSESFLGMYGKFKLNISLFYMNYISLYGLPLLLSLDSLFDGYIDL